MLLLLLLLLLILRSSSLKTAEDGDVGDTPPPPLKAGGRGYRSLSNGLGYYGVVRTTPRCSSIAYGYVEQSICVCGEYPL